MTLPKAQMQSVEGLTQPRRPDVAFAPDEPFGLAVQRAMLTNLDFAIDALRTWPDREEAVHRSRQAMKRLRAVLRLVRDELGQFTYRQENVVLRDTGRRISMVRTSAVQLRLAQQLRKRHPDLLTELEWLHLINGLRNRRDAIGADVLGDKALMTHILTTLLCQRARVASHPVVEPIVSSRGTVRRPIPDTWKVLAPSLCRVYRRGRVAAKRSAADNATHHEFHVWRKRVKYLRHQLELLAPAWPEIIGGHAERVHDLGDLLGDEHDLAEFAVLVDANPRLLHTDSTGWSLLRTIDGERRDLQRRAVQLGRVVYFESPGAFTDRIGVAVGAWRSV